jgi:hypothetical protein
MFAVVVLVGPAAAADAIAAGNIKSINPDKKTFVLRDAADKDFTFHFGDDLTVNRGGKESNGGLKEGDQVNVCYDKGTINWNAFYVLVKDGDTKFCHLLRVTFKSYDSTNKQIVVVDDAENKTWTLPLAKSTVRLNGQESNVDAVKIGSSAIVILHQERAADLPMLTRLVAWTK